MSAATTCAICGVEIPRDHPARFRRDGIDVVACAACGLVQRRELPEAAELDEIYQESYFRRPEGVADAQGYLDYVADEEMHRIAARKRLDRLARHTRRAGRALDVGCASGFFMVEARARGWDITGLDVSPAMTAVARERFGLDVETTTFAEAKLREPAFDLVTMWDYIEHTTDPVAEIERAAALLHPGGTLALSTGDAGSLTARLMGERWHLLTPRHHNFYFRRGDLRRLLRTAGFEVLEVRAWSRWATVAYLTYKLGSVLPDNRRVDAVAAWLAKRPTGRAIVPVNLFDVVTIVARRLSSPSRPVPVDQPPTRASERPHALTERGRGDHG